MKIIILVASLFIWTGCNKQIIAPASTLSGDWHYEDPIITLDISIDDKKQVVTGSYSIHREGVGLYETCTIAPFKYDKPFYYLVLKSQSGDSQLFITDLIINNSYSMLITNEYHYTRYGVQTGLSGFGVRRFISITRKP
jgi:hypothetical protein